MPFNGIAGPKPRKRRRGPPKIGVDFHIHCYINIRFEIDYIVGAKIKSWGCIESSNPAVQCPNISTLKWKDTMKLK
jgi:hypothetical protein